jgi:hypothetical protein
MKPIPSHELVGARHVGELPSADMVDLWVRVSSAIVKYGFVIEYRDLEPPRTGIFDGLRITIDPDVRFEMQCFLLLHLFGHSVQWVAPSLAEKVGELKNTNDRSRFMRVLHDYEFEAARFGMQLMRVRCHRSRPVVQRLRWDRLAICRTLLRDQPHSALDGVHRERVFPDSAGAHSAAGTAPS